jgi:Icc-related predicted phosphoesterase
MPETITCSCHFVDIGVGMQKAAEDPACPVCHEQDLAGMDIKTVLLVGDIHGNTSHLLWLVDKAKRKGVDAIFALGDFGIWDHYDDGRFTDTCAKEVEQSGIPIFFLPGNHDNYDLLEAWVNEKDRTVDGFVIVKPGLYYSPRAHRWTWNGVRFLSLGGAYSIDKEPRLVQDRQFLRDANRRKEQGQDLNAREEYMLKYEQMSWWRQEEITQEEADAASAPGGVDILLTHDKPYDSNPKWNRKNIPECEPNQEKIQQVVDKTEPGLLMHGHLHYAYSEMLATTQTFVKALDCDPSASRGTGGSGKRERSCAVLELNPQDKPGFWRLKWLEQDGTELSTAMSLPQSR